MNPWSSGRYAQFANGANFSDGLEELSEFPAASGKLSGIVGAAASRRRLPPHASPTIELFFSWCPCPGDAHAAFARLPERVRHVYQFVPAFWPMTGYCPSVLLDKQTLHTIGLTSRPSFEPSRELHEVGWY